MKIKQFKIYKCSNCKKRYKKSEMRAWYGADILLYDHQCVYCSEKKVNDPTPIELLDRILDLIWEVECDLKFENLLGHARDYVELTIRELKILKDEQNMRIKKRKSWGTM